MLPSFLLVFVLGVCSVTDAIIHRPAYIKPCSRSNANFDQCTIESVQYALPFIVKGDKHLKIPSMNPLKISLLELQGDQNFRIKLQNIKIYGLDNIKVLKIKTNFDTQTVNFMTYADRIDIIGDYDMSGRLLVFPLEGKGPCKISLLKGTYEYEFQWAIENKNGVDYAKISKLNKYDYNLNGTISKFDNLFNGDEAIGSEVNKLLNESWMDVNRDLKQAMIKAFLAFYDDTAGKIYSNIPFKELVLD